MERWDIERCGNGMGEMPNGSNRDRRGSGARESRNELAVALRRARVAVISLILLAALVCRTSPAAAQAPNRAEELFDQGVAALKAGAFEAACSALAESYGLEPELGALLALADCLDRWGKLHSATRRYGQYVAEASSLSARERAYREPQLKFARDALARLEPNVPRLTFLLPARAAEVRVMLDDAPLALASAEQGVRVDPGHHVIETQAAGRAAWRLELDVEAGQRLDVQLELGSALVPESPPTTAPSTAAPSTTAPPTAAPSPPQTAQRAEPLEEAAPSISTRDSVEPASAWRTLGWGLGGLGVAGLGVGSVAGVLLLQTCPQLDCGSRGERGRSLALATDVGFGVGVAALVASAVVLLQTAAPAVSTDTAHWRPLAGVQAGGGWIGMSQDW